MAENDLKRIEAGLAVKQVADAEKRAAEVEKAIRQGLKNIGCS